MRPCGCSLTSGLDECLGDFLVRVVPQALVRLVGWKVTLKELRASLIETAEILEALAQDSLSTRA